MANATVGERGHPRQSLSPALQPLYSALLELPSPDFPATAEGDIERQQNQTQVEPEILPLNIKEIITELVPPGHIAIGEDLGHPCQAWSDRQAGLESWNCLIWQLLVWPFSLHLVNREGPRPHKAHVPLQDVPQLWQLIESADTKPVTHPRRAGVVRRGLH